MTKDIIQQIIKEKEIALNEVPSDLKDNIILLLIGYLDKWQFLDFKSKIMEIDTERMKYSGWHLRLTDKREDIGQEKIITTLNRYKFFIYPDLALQAQFDTWIFVLRICLTFLDKVGMQEISKVNKGLIDNKIISFQSPKQENFYYFIDSTNTEIYTFEPISFWLNKTDYSNIREGILLHLKVILEEQAKSWFENIQENILASTSNKKQAISDFKEKLSDDIKPLVKDLPVDYIRQFDTFDILAPKQILPFLTLESIRNYHNSIEKNDIDRVKKSIAEYVYRSIMKKNDHPKELFDKIRAFYVKRMINDKIMILSTPSKARNTTNDLTSLELFRQNQERLDSFLELLKRPYVRVLNEKNEWIYSKNKNSVVGCFEVLKEKNYIKADIKNTVLLRSFATIIRFDCSPNLYGKGGNPDDYDFFRDLFNKHRF